MAVNASTILHVEDDPNDVLLIARAFRKAEVAAQVQVVNDGEQALHYLAGSNSFAQRRSVPIALARAAGSKAAAEVRDRSA